MTLNILLLFFIAASSIVNALNNSSSNDHLNANISDAEVMRARKLARQQEVDSAAAKARKKYHDGMRAAKSTIEAGSSENCDWWKDSLPLLRGEVCGKYYKVLGLDKSADRASIKKAYRTKSLDLHPDKNPSQAAQPAFNLITEAYECLSDERCRRKYDESIYEEEIKIVTWRQQKLQLIKNFAIEAVINLYISVSVAADYYYRAANYIWEFVGRWVISDFPIGKCALILGLLFKGRRLLFLQWLSFIIWRINHERSKL